MLARLIAAQNRRNWHPYTFLLFCGFVGLMRGVLEILLQGILLYNSDVFNFIPFYILLGLMLTGVLSLTAGISFQSVQRSLIMGLFVGLFPPIFDFFIFRNSSAFYGYYYVWDFINLPYHGYKPEFNFPAGETLAIWLSITFCGAYVYIVSGKIWRSVAALAGAYLVFIFMGSLLPMLLAKFSGISLTTLEDARRADPQTLRALALRIAFYQAFLALLVYLTLRVKLLLHLLRRMLHIIPFVMLTLLGGTAVHTNAVSLMQAVFLIFAFGLVALVQNNYFDTLESRQGGKNHIAAKFDVQIINVLYILALIPLFMLNSRTALAGLIIFVCGILYNYPLYRARNHFPANLKIEGVWGLSAFLAGSLLEPQAASRSGILLMAFLVFGGWSTVAVLKDLKDAEEDHQDGVQTVFTLLMRRGYSVSHVWQGVRWVLMALFMIPAILAYGRLPLLPFITLASVTAVIYATFWLKNYRLAFQAQLGLIAAYLGFWQVAFSQAWISL